MRTLWCLRTDIILSLVSQRFTLGCAVAAKLTFAPGLLWSPKGHATQAPRTSFSSYARQMSTIAHPTGGRGGGEGRGGGYRAGIVIAPIFFFNEGILSLLSRSTNSTTGWSKVGPGRAKRTWPPAGPWISMGHPVFPD